MSIRFLSSLVVALALMAVLAAAPAQAAWTPAVRVAPTSAGSWTQTAVAIDARGDAAVAWMGNPAFTNATTLTVHVAYRRGWSGRFVSRTIFRRRGSGAHGPAVALDARGELTVAWIDRPVTGGRLHGHITVRAAFRTTSGRWSPVQEVGRSSPFAYAFPELAAAPDRSVLLTYQAGIAAAPGTAVAWRRAGHRFGTIRALRGIAGLKRPLLQEPTTAFDPGGRAYVAGIAGCDGGASRGVVFTAAPGSRRFGAARVVAPAPATHLRFAVTGADAAVAAWRTVGCSTTEDLSGGVSGAAVHAGVPAAPVQLDARSGGGVGIPGLHVAGAPQAGGDVAWSFGGDPEPPSVLAAHVDAAGAWTSPSAVADRAFAVVADAPGDQLVQRDATAWARPASGGADVLAPIGAGAPIQEPGVSAWLLGAGVPGGAGLIAADRHRGVVVSTWRP